MMEGERKLATIRRVSKIEPIPGADAIVKLIIDGWELVSGKDNFQEGDLCVYFEIDSFLPVRPEFEFLRDRCFKSTKNLGDGFRLKTIKLRGQVSQGLALPLSDFFKQVDGLWYYMREILLEPSMTPDEIASYVEEGTDVTEYLGVQKYEKPVPAALAGQVRGNFPSFLRKTDQERVQNCLNGVKNWIFYEKDDVQEVFVVGDAMDAVFSESPDHFKSGDKWFKKTRTLRDSEVIAHNSIFEATLKVDGSSMTIYNKDQAQGVCSRNLDLKRDPENVFWKVAIASGILGILAQSGMHIAVQGELMGPGVQNNREQLKDHRLFIFDIYLIDEERYATPDERWNVVQWLHHNGMPIEVAGHVPFAFEDKKLIVIGVDDTVQTFLDQADSIKSINHDIAEGIVYKSVQKNGPTFKAISNKFLLKEKD